MSAKMRSCEKGAPLAFRPRLANTRNHSQLVLGISLSFIDPIQAATLLLSLSLSGSQKSLPATARVNPIGHDSTIR